MEGPRVYRRKLKHLSEEGLTESRDLETRSDAADKKPEIEINRRRFLRQAIAAAGAAALLKPTRIGKEVINDLPQAYREPEPEPAPEIVENSERHSKAFETLVSGFTAQVNLKYNQVLFVDQNNVPIGQPVTFKDFTVKREVIAEDGTKSMKPYALTPGATYSDGKFKGFLRAGIAGEWIDYVKETHGQQNGISPKKLKGLNVEPDMTAALMNSKESELSSGIIAGVIETPVDVAHYFGSKPVSSDDTRTRLQYVSEETRFDETGLNLPEVTQRELRKYVVGLVATESKFNDNIPKNSDTARDAFQITDMVRKKYGYDADEKLTFPEQVEVAGKTIADSYRQLFGIVQKDNPDGMYTIRSHFSSEEAFQKYFVVPCLLNAYNCGVGLMGAAVKEFEQTQLSKSENEVKSDGYDLFLRLTEHAYGKNYGYNVTYGDDAKRYVPYIFAYTKSMQGRSD